MLTLITNKVNKQHILKTHRIKCEIISVENKIIPYKITLTNNLMNKSISFNYKCLLVDFYHHFNRALLDIMNDNDINDMIIKWEGVKNETEIY